MLLYYEMEWMWVSAVVAYFKNIFLAFDRRFCKNQYKLRQSEYCLGRIRQSITLSATQRRFVSMPRCCSCILLEWLKNTTKRLVSYSSRLQIRSLTASANLSCTLLSECLPTVGYVSMDRMWHTMPYITLHMSSENYTVCSALRNLVTSCVHLPIKFMLLQEAVL